jgi:hypothetical protein
VAAQVCQLLENPEHAWALAAAARETCDAYRWPEVREGWLAAYRSVLAPAARPTRQPVEAS